MALKSSQTATLSIVDLNKFGLPYYLYLGEELVIVEKIEKRKTQIYYHLKDGRVKHASFFKKVDTRVLKRDYLIDSILDCENL